MLIKLKNMQKTYGKKALTTHALNGISLEIEEGEMLAVMGVSGSGKSTLLNILGCLDKPTGGKYFLRDKDITTYTAKQMAKLRNETFGFVLQDFALIERYTVAQNVMIPLRYSKKYVSGREKRVDEILQQLDIYKKKNQLSLRLSGGQRQRVAIGRAIVNDAEILLCDEPTGSLDSKTAKEIMQIFKDLNAKGKTVIIVTHDKEIAGQCERIIEISDGKII